MELIICIERVLYGSVWLPHKNKYISRTYDLASRFTIMPTYTHNISSLILEVETQNWYQIEA